ncbi:hypothetical protein [Paracoccus mutanolyticus]|uniref:hypothetical protein n=1 Tax=Paracoccus mutanolyticus TaxID=1499308 RepID=UPI001671C30D|nr:hypothetical protein [Paracoccus mutanolyticus]
MKKSGYMDRSMRAAEPRFAACSASSAISAATWRRPRARSEPDALDALRANGQAVVGNRAYHGWDAAGCARRSAAGPVPFRRCDSGISPAACAILPATGSWRLVETAYWKKTIEVAALTAKKNAEVHKESCPGVHAVLACMTLIARDYRPVARQVVAQDDKGIWTDVEPGKSPDNRKPNTYQTAIPDHAKRITVEASGSNERLQGRAIEASSRRCTAWTRSG